MTADPGLSHARAATGEFSLYVPGDWLDLLADGSGPGADVAARARFVDLVRKTYPKAEPEIEEGAVDGLLAWRAMVTERGMVSHGVVNCPVRADEADAGEGWAAWHVLSAVLDVPRITPDVDVGELLARLMGQQLDVSSAYVESFSTDMGCGVGLVLQPTMPSSAYAVRRGGEDALDSLAEAGPAAPDTAPIRYGLVVALACPVGGGPGLLVTGICLDPTQLLELAGLVAIIASRSRVTPLGDAEDDRI